VNNAGRSTKTLAVLAAALGLALIACSPASASFTRPFLHQIARTENTPKSSTTPCSETEVAAGAPCLAPSGGIALDAGGDVWVADKSFGGLDEFSPAFAVEPNAFLKTLAIGSQGGESQAAIESATSGDFYVTHQTTENNPAYKDIEVFSPVGTHLETWSQNFDTPHIAIDNATLATGPLDPSKCGSSPLLPEECFVYVTEEDHPGIQKLSSKGTSVEFADAKKCEAEKCGYIEGATITGVPPSSGVECLTGGFSKGSFIGSDSQVRDLAVDSEGNIYVVVGICKAVLEYSPSGEYLREFPVNGTGPTLGDGGSGPVALAYDPVSGHLLVSLEGEENNSPLGGIDEFEPATGKYIGQITESAEGAALPTISQLAVDSNGDLYAVGGYAQDRTVGHAVYVWGPGAFLPSATLDPAGEREGDSAVLSSSVNPEGFKLDRCEFQYVN
jgi:hypothetical protein